MGREYRKAYAVVIAKNFKNIGLLVKKILEDFESLERELRAEEITGLNVRLRTARECAEIADKTNASGSGGREIRKKFEVPA